MKSVRPQHKRKNNNFYFKTSGAEDAQRWTKQSVRGIPFSNFLNTCTIEDETEATKNEQVANKRMYHELFWKDKRQNPKSILKEELTELWLRDNEGSSRIWGWISSWTGMVWTLKRKGGKWRTLIWGFSEWEEITPLGGGSKISEEDPPLWIGDSKIRIGGSEENLETWEKTQIFI